MSSPRIAIYWDGEQPPAYLTMCVSSWLRFIPLRNLVFLNLSNIDDYLSEYVSVEDLRQLTFAKQSDVVSACYLAKYGGCFMDADTVFTNENCLTFVDPSDSGKLKLFSYHIGALSVQAGNPALIHWASKTSELVKQRHSNQPWNSVGNAILDPFLNESTNSHLVDRLPVLDSEVTPERLSKFWREFSEGMSRPDYYRTFWFKPGSPKDELNELISQSESGIVCLHNSWTPKSVWDLSKEEIMSSNLPMAKFITAFADLESFKKVEEALIYGTPAKQVEGSADRGE